MELFFFGIGDGSAKKAIETFTQKFNIMINYAAKVRTIPRNTDKLFVDSGGFSFFYKLKEYPDSHLEYLHFVYRVKADHFANRDYPCEPEIQKKWGVSVRENQLRTIENQIKLMELIEDYYPSLKKRFVAVLQGWTIDEYLWMLDYMREHGLLTELIGLGTMCRRGQDEQIRRCILTIRENLHKRYKLHGFGIKFSVLKYKDVWGALYSADSLAYRYYIDRVKDSRPIWLQIRERIERWLSELEKLRKMHTSQEILVEA